LLNIDLRGAWGPRAIRPALVRRDGERVRLFSRHGLDWTEQVPTVVAAVLALGTRSALIDGEAVVARDEGVTDFDALRSALASRNGRSAAVFLYAFDLMELDDEDMRRQPWHCAAMACKLGLEGIVSKRPPELGGLRAICWRQAGRRPVREAQRTRSAGTRSRSSIVTPPPVVPPSRHSVTVRIRLSASVRTPKPAPPMTTPTPGAGRSSTILHR